MIAADKEDGQQLTTQWPVGKGCRKPTQHHTAQLPGPFRTGDNHLPTSLPQGATVQLLTFETHSPGS